MARRPDPQQPQQPNTVYVANQPRRTMHGPSFLGKIGWWCLIICTCGLAYPWYHRAKRTSRHVY
ncbi:hypothetical protein [Streptomyces albogriseolus]|uniref:hypothetical protein n=1 Tax=Streptomyces albogriseolus TaxID=1887 RepID=UPI00345F4C97